MAHFLHVLVYILPVVCRLWCNIMEGFCIYCWQA